MKTEKELKEDIVNYFPSQWKTSHGLPIIIDAFADVMVKVFHDEMQKLYELASGVQIIENTALDEKTIPKEKE